MYRIKFEINNKVYYVIKKFHSISECKKWLFDFFKRNPKMQHKLMNYDFEKIDEE